MSNTTENKLILIDPKTGDLTELHAQDALLRFAFGFSLQREPDTEGNIHDPGC